MKFKNINKKILDLSLGLTFTSVVCVSCAINKSEINQNVIDYDDLVNNYKIVEITALDNQTIHILKKEKIENMPNCYGYYDIFYHKCIIKVDEKNGFIIGNGFITNVLESDIEGYLDMYKINKNEFNYDDLGLIVDMIRNDYLDNGKRLAKLGKYEN